MGIIFRPNRRSQHHSQSESIYAQQEVPVKNFKDDQEETAKDECMIILMEINYMVCMSVKKSARLFHDMRRNSLFLINNTINLFLQHEQISLLIS